MKFKGRRATTILGVVTLASLVATAVMALVVSPPDEVQHDAVRLLYVHVPTAWVAMYLAFGITSLASALYLYPRTRRPFWDALAGASAEVGVLFIGLTLVLGSDYGRTTWGIWWTWDARLTSTAILFVLYLGYLAVRRVQAEPVWRAKLSAIVALGAFLAVPLVHFSVEWWRTLHQTASVLDDRRLGKPLIHGSMLATLLLGVAAFTLLYVWLLIHRYRVGAMEQVIDDRGLELAIAERQAEAAADFPSFLSPSTGSEPGFRDKNPTGTGVTP